MTTVQLILVCVTVLAVVAVAAWLARELVKDATTTRIVLSENDVAARRSEAALARADAAAELARARAQATAEMARAREQAAADRADQAAASLVGRAVLINTVGKTAVRGIVHADLPDRLTLRDAAVLEVGRDAEAPAGGLLHVMRERIDLVQDIPSPPAADLEARRAAR